MSDDDQAPTRVLLVEDYDLAREGLTKLLNSQPDIDVVAETATVAGAINLVTELAPQVAILDLQLPDGNGFDLCQRIRSISPTTICIIHSSLGVDPHTANKAGAAAIVLKQLTGNKLLEAIRSHRPSQNHDF